jgi:hypothetical protein
MAACAVAIRAPVAGAATGSANGAANVAARAAPARAPARSNVVWAQRPTSPLSARGVLREASHSWRDALAREGRSVGGQASSFLPSVVFALKLLASVLAGAAITSTLWPGTQKAVAPDSFSSRYVFPPDPPETRIYRSLPRLDEPADAEIGRGIPSNYPRRVKTVIFLPPTNPGNYSSIDSLLRGKPLRYLIGTDRSGGGRDGEVTVVSYSTSEPARRGVSVAYCNLFDENNTGKYGPYLHTSDTAQQYNEGQIDPRGQGWEKNLREQFERRKRQGFEYIELDNPDAYAIKDVIGAIELASTYGLKVIAKNPKLMQSGAASYVAHPNVYGIIVEKGAGNPDDMDSLRRKAGKPDMPVWFVAFGSGRQWAKSVASSAKSYRNMGVTYSSAGEYGNAIDILPPA